MSSYLFVNSFLFPYSIFNEQNRTQPGLNKGVLIRFALLSKAPLLADLLSGFASHRVTCFGFRRASPDFRHPALPGGRSGWTRTIDLALIRRAL